MTSLAAALKLFQFSFTLRVQGIQLLFTLRFQGIMIRFPKYLRFSKPNNEALKHYNLIQVFFGGEEFRSCQCARFDLEGERRRPELARVTMSRGDRRLSRGELEVMQGEQVVIESNERARTNHIGSINVNVFR